MRIMPFNSSLSNLNGTNKTNFKGWSPQKAESKKQIAKMKQVLDTSSIKSAAVSGHKYPDEDSIGACFAAAFLLNKKLNVPVDVYLFGSLPKKFDYLKNNDNIRVINLYADNKGIFEGEKPYDLAVSVDTSSSNLMNSDYFQNVFKNAKHTFKIDHHKTPNNVSYEKKYQFDYADINFVDAESPSASELVMQLVKPFGLSPKEIDNKFNEAVYAGILGDTGRFAFAENEQPFYDAALLIKNGADPQKILKKMNQPAPKAVSDILKLAQSKVEYCNGSKIAYLYKDEEITNAIKALNDKNLEMEAENRLKMLISHLKNNQDIEISVLCSKRKDNELYISMRSADKDIRKFAYAHGGGGHEKAAAFSIKIDENLCRDDIDKIIKDVVKELADLN